MLPTPIMDEAGGCASVGLPPELWIVIFRFATYLPRFFDARWDQKMATPFDDARDGVRDTHLSFATSMVRSLYDPAGSSTHC